MPDRTVLSTLLTRSFNQALTAEEGTALHNLQTMTSKIPLSGAGLASVSMLVTAASGTAASNRKKSRLEAMAASRERRLEGSQSDTDSDGEEAGLGAKQRHNRGKMTRSLTLSSRTEPGGKRGGCQSEQGELGGPERGGAGAGEKAAVLSSSTSADPGSSSAANTASSAAASSASGGSLVRQQWTSQGELQQQVECGQREVERLRSELAGAESKLGRVEASMAQLVGASSAGLEGLREQLAGMRSQVTGEREDALASLGSLTSRMVDSLQQLQALQSSLPADLERERCLRTEADTELEQVPAVPAALLLCVEPRTVPELHTMQARNRLETEVNKLDDCHREIEIYRHQLEEQSGMLDCSKQELQLCKERMAEEYNVMKADLEKEIVELKTKFKKEKKELKQALELEHELELDNFKERSALGESDKLDRLNEELSVMKGHLNLKEDELKRVNKKIEDYNTISESKNKVLASLEDEFHEQHSVELIKLEKSLRAQHKLENEKLKEEKNEEMMERMEELRQRMVESSQLSVERLKSNLEKQQQKRLSEKEVEMQAKFDAIKSEFEDAKHVEIEEAKDRVRKKSKMELETLRSRFKIMQTTSGLERSPSVSESEFSIEVRQTVFDSKEE